MISQAERNRMTQFIADRLEDSGLHDILERDEDHVLVKEKFDDLPLFSATVYVAAHNKRTTKRNVRNLWQANVANGVYTAHVLYKDGENFLVKLGEKAESKRERSLKRLSPEELNATVHLRDLEKLLMQRFESDRLQYYQPETEDIPEALRFFHMGQVLLDMSHIDKDHPAYGFVEDRYSTDYRIVREAVKSRITVEPAYLLCGETMLRRAVITKHPNPVHS